MHEIATQKRVTSADLLFNPLIKIRSYSTRSSAKANFFIKRTNTELGKKSLDIFGARVGLWSVVPNTIKNLSFYSFTISY